MQLNIIPNSELMDPSNGMFGIRVSGGMYEGSKPFSIKIDKYLIQKFHPTPNSSSLSGECTQAPGSVEADIRT